MASDIESDAPLQRLHEDSVVTHRNNYSASRNDDSSESATTDTYDFPNEYGHTSCEEYSSEYSELSEPQINANLPSLVDNSWEINYREAAIYLEEGENNDKFSNHPNNRRALPAYLLTHNRWFYSVDFAAALLLMSLAVMEDPAVAFFKNVPVGIHGTIELFGLAFTGISILLQLRWLGLCTFLRHKRSMIKTCTWIIMIFEAFIILIRNTNHFRVTRALRPIFFIDNRYQRGVRRFLRQILQSVPPILEVLVILLFALLIFTVLGFYLFSWDPKNPFFTTFQDGFVSLFVLLTTANFPDVMLPSYEKNRWTAAFFILFLAINFYFLMNLMLAVVFHVFSDIEKDKFRKLLMHKRRACQYAFRLLVTQTNPSGISFRHFQGVMKYLRPKVGHQESYLIFKALNESSNGQLSLAAFYGMYDKLNYRWLPCFVIAPWFSNLPTPIREACFLIRRLVTWVWFEYLTYVVIMCSAVSLMIRTAMHSISFGPAYYFDFHVTWDQLGFVSFYTLEAILKLIGLGLKDYFSSGWNRYDFVATLLSIAGIISDHFSHSFFCLIVLRPIKLLRLFSLRRRYRDVFQTLLLLLPRIGSAIIVIILTFYFFAIIGMELFSVFDLRNCCINTTVEQYYKDDNTTVYINYYYLNNFNDLFMAGITLFELTVVNNWFIIMEAYASVTNQWSRLYFMLFYLVMMVVMSVVVAFILEAFTFRMQYMQKVEQLETDESVQVCVSLSLDELKLIFRNRSCTDLLQQYSQELQTQGAVKYRGIGRTTKGVLQRRMYEDEIPVWLHEIDESWDDTRFTNHRSQASHRFHSVTSQSNENNLTQSEGDRSHMPDLTHFRLGLNHLTHSLSANLINFSHDQARGSLNLPFGSDQSHASTPYNPVC